MRILFLVLLLTVAACSATGSDVTHTLEVAYPADAEQIALTLRTDTGTLDVTAGSGASVQGNVTTNVAEWRPNTGATGNIVTIERGAMGSNRIPNATLAWNLTVGDALPLDLTVEAGTATTTLSLGGLPLRSLTIRGDDNPLALRFDSPRADAGTANAVIEARDADVDVTGLLNASLERLDIDTTSGTQTLTFDGGGQSTTTRAFLEARSGDVVLRFGGDAPARVILRSTSGRAIQVDGGFIETSAGVFDFGGYDESNAGQLGVIAEVRTVSGDLRLVNIGG